MAQYYGVISGARGPASRLGHKSTGLSTHAEGWGGKVIVHLAYDARRGEDMARVTLESKDGKLLAELYDGPLNRFQPENESLLTLLALRSLTEDAPQVDLGAHIELLRTARDQLFDLSGLMPKDDPRFQELRIKVGILKSLLADALGPFKDMLPEEGVTE